MPNKFIYRDEQNISTSIATIKRFLPFLQSLDTCLRKVGYDFNEEEMLHFLRLIAVAPNKPNTANSTPESLRIADPQRFDNAPESLRSRIQGMPSSEDNESKPSYLTTEVLDYLKEKMIERNGGTATVGTLTISKDKLKELIELPDLSELNELVTYKGIQSWLEYSKVAGIGKEGAFIELGSKGYYITDNAEQTITERYTYRTTTEKGDKFLDSLQIICDGLNSFDHSYIPIEIDASRHASPIKKLHTGKYVPSFEFISMYEKL